MIRTLRRDIARYNKEEEMVSYFKGSMKAFFYYNSGLVKHWIVLIIAFATLFDLFVVIELG